MLVTVLIATTAIAGPSHRTPGMGGKAASTSAAGNQRREPANGPPSQINANWTARKALLIVNGETCLPPQRYSGKNGPPVVIANDDRSTAHHHFEEQAIVHLQAKVVARAGLYNAAGDAIGSGSASRFTNLRGIHPVAGSNRMWYADWGPERVRQVGPDGTTYDWATASTGTMSNPRSPVYVSSQDRLYYISAAAYVHYFDVSDPSTSTVFAGQAGAGYVDGVGGAARFSSVVHLAIGDDAAIYASDSSKIRRIAVSNADVTTVAGDGTSATTDGIGVAAQFDGPNQLQQEFATSGAFYIGSDKFIRKMTITPSYSVTTLLGKSTPAGVSSSSGTPTGVYVGTVLALAIYPSTSGASIILYFHCNAATFSRFRKFQGNYVTHLLSSTAGAQNGINLNGQIDAAYAMAFHPTSLALWVADEAANLLVTIAIGRTVTPSITVSTSVSATHTLRLRVTRTPTWTVSSTTGTSTVSTSVRVTGSSSLTWATMSISPSGPRRSRVVAAPPTTAHRNHTPTVSAPKEPLSAVVTLSSTTAFCASTASGANRSVFIPSTLAECCGNVTVSPSGPAYKCSTELAACAASKAPPSISACDSYLDECVAPYTNCLIASALAIPAATASQLPCPWAAYARSLATQASKKFQGSALQQQCQVAAARLVPAGCLLGDPTLLSRHFNASVLCAAPASAAASAATAEAATAAADNAAINAIGGSSESEAYKVRPRLLLKLGTSVPTCEGCDGFATGTTDRSEGCETCPADLSQRATFNGFLSKAALTAAAFDDCGNALYNMTLCGAPSTGVGFHVANWGRAGTTSARSFHVQQYTSQCEYPHPATGQCSCPPPTRSMSLPIIAQLRGRNGLQTVNVTLCVAADMEAFILADEALDEVSGTTHAAQPESPSPPKPPNSSSPEFRRRCFAPFNRSSSCQCFDNSAVAAAPVVFANTTGGANVPLGGTLFVCSAVDPPNAKFAVTDAAAAVAVSVVSSLVGGPAAASLQAASLLASESCDSNRRKAAAASAAIPFTIGGTKAGGLLFLAVIAVSVAAAHGLWMTVTALRAGRRGQWAIPGDIVSTAATPVNVLTIFALGRFPNWSMRLWAMCFQGMIYDACRLLSSYADLNGIELTIATLSLLLAVGYVVATVVVGVDTYHRHRARLEEQQLSEARNLTAVVPSKSLSVTPTTGVVDGCSIGSRRRRGPPPVFDLSNDGDLTLTSARGPFTVTPPPAPSGSPAKEGLPSPRSVSPAEYGNTTQDSSRTGASAFVPSPRDAAAGCDTAFSSGRTLPTASADLSTVKSGTATPAGGSGAGFTYYQDYEDSAFAGIPSVVVVCLLPSGYWCDNPHSLRWSAAFSQFGPRSLRVLGSIELVKGLAIASLAAPSATTSTIICSRLYTALAMLLFVFAGVFIVFRPYRRPLDNLAGGILTLLTAIMVLTVGQSSVQVDKTKVFNGIFYVAMVAVGLAVVQFIAEKWLMRRQSRDAHAAAASAPPPLDAPVETPTSKVHGDDVQLARQHRRRSSYLPTARSDTGRPSARSGSVSVGGDEVIQFDADDFSDNDGNLEGDDFGLRRSPSLRSTPRRWGSMRKQGSFRNHGPQSPHHAAALPPPMNSPPGFVPPGPIEDAVESGQLENDIDKFFSFSVSAVPPKAVTPPAVAKPPSLSVSTTTGGNFTCDPFNLPFPTTTMPRLVGSGSSAQLLRQVPTEGSMHRRDRMVDSYVALDLDGGFFGEVVSDK